MIRYHYDHPLLITGNYPLSGDAEWNYKDLLTKSGGTFVDCTFGGGGYSRNLLKFNNTKVLFDR